MKNLGSVIFLIIFATFILLTGFDVSCRDKGGKHYIDARTAQGLREIFRYTGDSVSFLSAHRGGPEKNLPENCIATFANTLMHTYSIMEIDPRYTKDSAVIVHHDPTLQRTTTGNGRVSDFTLEEAKQCYKLNKNIMIQVFISNPEKVREFDQTGVPWENIVAFVGHKKPDDPAVFQIIHQKGALCILGTSRNLDREYLDGKVANIEELQKGYNALYREGADILEADIPVQVYKVVAKRLSLETFKSKFLK